MDGRSEGFQQFQVEGGAWMWGGRDGANASGWVGTMREPTARALVQKGDDTCLREAFGQSESRQERQASRALQRGPAPSLQLTHRPARGCIPPSDRPHPGSPRVHLEVYRQQRGGRQEVEAVELLVEQIHKLCPLRRRAADVWGRQGGGGRRSGKDTLGERHRRQARQRALPAARK